MACRSTFLRSHIFSARHLCNCFSMHRWAGASSFLPVDLSPGAPSFGGTLGAGCRLLNGSPQHERPCHRWVGRRVGTASGGALPLIIGPASRRSDLHCCGFPGIGGSYWAKFLAAEMASAFGMGGERPAPPSTQTGRHKRAGPQHIRAGAVAFPGVQHSQQDAGGQTFWQLRLWAQSRLNALRPATRTGRWPRRFWLSRGGERRPCRPVAEKKFVAEGPAFGPHCRGTNRGRCRPPSFAGRR